MTPIHNVVLVLLDSLNRHMLGCYGGEEFATPSIDRLARRSVRFTRHYVGSLPCMPARHDILCGALDFLWRPWGSIEIWEDAVTARLRAAGVVTQLITDHPHLFETGGETIQGWRRELGPAVDAQHVPVETVEQDNDDIARAGSRGGERRRLGHSLFVARSGRPRALRFRAKSFGYRFENKRRDEPQQ